MQSIHKLTAGNGYTYLTQQVAAMDSTQVSDGQLAQYYSAKGESPGRWVGAGLAGVEGITAGDQVSEEQMKALFGVGRHPDADAMYERLVTGGMKPKKALEATQLGSVFAVPEADPSEFLKLTSRAYRQWNTAHGHDRNAPIPQEERSIIRDQVGRETFITAYGRAPLDERELSGHIVASSRPAAQKVAGYDLTFSPVKSVSVLWALAPREVAAQVEAAHDAAVAETIGWIESEVLHTRRGTNGVRTVDVRGAVATAFTHRDSRAGDPDLHTHVAIANKVQDGNDGAWRSIDGKTLFKATVASSERYNTALESQLSTRLGVTFAPTPGKGNGTRVIREVVGIDGGLADHFSARRAMITTKLEELTADFHAAHHRPPTTKEMLSLAQQANLETREDKHEPRSLAEQRQTWRDSAGQFLGGGDQVEAMLAGVSEQATTRTARLSEGQLKDVAGHVLYAVQSRRARFQPPHVIAETQRQIRSLDLDPAVVQATVEHVVALVLTEQAIAQPLTRPEPGPVAVRIDAVDPVVDPASLRRSDGASVYETPLARLFTTTHILAAEQALITAAKTTGARAASVNAVDIALLTSVANGATLNPAQAQMVTEMATSGRAVQLALAPAGSGKTTSMRALAAAWTEDGGTIVGLAPSAVAAQELSDAIDGDTDTLTKLTYDLTHGGTPATAWEARIGADTMVIIDEAGMAGTIELAQAVGFITARGGCVRLVGDDQQLASVAAGGVLRDIATEVGAVTLSELHRFTVPGEGEATLALRAGDPQALGFYLDHGRTHPDGSTDQHRVRVGAPGELPGMVFDAWRTDLHQGRDALMLASTNDTVNDLNTRARADKIAAGDVSPHGGITLASGLQASAGDRIITRRNNRALRLTPTDHVKNGDRWTVRDTHDDGSLDAVHTGTGRVLHLPADYVAADVDLGYACTVHGAQGQTVDSSYVLLTGDETRQQLYVALSRGRRANVMFVPTGGDGDEHAMLHPEQITPPTAVDLLEQVIARDGAQVSARTEIRTENAPETLIARAAERYADTLNMAATTTLGTAGMADLTARAEHAVPGVSTAPAWDTLAAHLALIHLNGTDPIAALAAAAGDRELDTGLDIAAVLDWRLDPTNTHPAGTHSGGVGPLPWLPAIPSELAQETNPFASALAARHDQVTALAARIHDQEITRATADLPAWGTALDTDRDLLADVATWRAAGRVPDQDATMTGPPRAGVAAQRHQRSLNARVDQVAGPAHAGNAALRAFVLDLQPRLAADPWWPVLADRLNLAAQAGLPVQHHVTTASARGPLPDQHQAAALWSRLATHLAPASGVAATAGSGATRLRPPWTDTLTGLLPDGVAARVLTDPQWPILVAAVQHAANTTSHDADQVITAAVGLLGAANLPTVDGHDPATIPLGSLTTVLAWRVTDLTSPPPVQGQLLTEADVLDTDVQDYLTATAHERHTHGHHTPGRRESTPTDPAPRGGLEEDNTAPQVDDEQLTPPADLYDTTAIAAGRVHELVNAAGAWFEGNYDHSPAQEHVTARFGTDLSDTAYRVGYAPPGWNNLATHLATTHDATPEELISAGLAKWSSRDTLIDIFRDRLTLGIHDTTGQLVGFTARDLSGREGTPKYLNTPTTDTFLKGHVLFGLHEATAHASTPLAASLEVDSEVVIPTESPRLVRVEGAMDAIAITLAGAGTIHGVAPLGTALTDTQADLLAAHAHHDTAWLGLDTDAAGHAAQRKDFDALTARGLTVRSIPLNGVKDPAQFYTQDPEWMATLLALADQAPLTTEDLTDHRITTGADMHHNTTLSITATVHAARAIAQMIAGTEPTLWDQQIQYAATRLTASIEQPLDTATEHAHWVTTISTAVIENATGWQPPAHHDHPTDPQRQAPRVTPPMPESALRIQALIARMDKDATPQTPAERATAFQALRARMDKDATPQTPAERAAAFQALRARMDKDTPAQKPRTTRDDPTPQRTTPTIRPR